MPPHPFRLSVPLSVALVGLLLAGCAGGDADPAVEDPGPTATAPEGGAGTTDDLAQGPQGEDPNARVEDGAYRGEGVVLPVPDGFTLDQAAAAQGMVAAVNADGTQQLTAQAVDTDSLGEQGQSLELEALLENVRGQIPQEPAVDEAVEISGAERAHRFTFLGLPPQQEGGLESSVTIVLAEDGDGLLAEFVFAATSDAYEEELADLLLAEAGFDPDSEPPAQPQQRPVPAEPDDGSGDG